MKLYHTYESKNGFNLNRYDFNRGLFSIEPWWIGRLGYEKYNEFTPDDFGDSVVELDVKDNVKTFKAGDQLDILEEFFPDDPNAKKIIDQYEKGDFHRKEDWQKLDEFVGKFIKKGGYKMIHYTDDSMYGDVWVILDKSIIKNVKFEDEKMKKEDLKKMIKEEILMILHESINYNDLTEKEAFSIAKQISKKYNYMATIEDVEKELKKLGIKFGNGIDDYNVGDFFNDYFLAQDHSFKKIQESKFPHRYVATMEFYVFANDANLAKQYAEDIAKQVDSQHDNKASITDIVQQEFGQIGNTRD